MAFFGSPYVYHLYIHKYLVLTIILKNQYEPKESTINTILLHLLCIFTIATIFLNLLYVAFITSSLSDRKNNDRILHLVIWHWQDLKKYWSITFLIVFIVKCCPKTASKQTDFRYTKCSNINSSSITASAWLI